jgi:hypothetical protein
MNTGIRAASETMRSVLTDKLRGDPDLGMLFSGVSAAEVSLLNPDEMNAAGITGLSVWLYRVVRDEQLLNQPPVRVAPGAIRPTPLPVRLHYLIAPLIGGDGGTVPIETRHHVLGAVLQCFYDRPLISGAGLSGDLAGTTAEIAVRLESPPMDELARIWDTLDSGYTLSLSYEVSIVAIETVRPDMLVSPVRVSEPGVGPAVPEFSA